MSRKKLPSKDKKQTISIQIPNEILPLILDIDNKSKFFECLLIEYFSTLSK